MRVGALALAVCACVRGSLLTIGDAQTTMQQDKATPATRVAIARHVLLAAQFLQAKGVALTDVRPSTLMRFTQGWRFVGIDSAVQLDTFGDWRLPVALRSPQVLQRGSRPMRIVHTDTLWALGMVVLRLCAGDVFVGLNDDQVARTVLDALFRPPVHAVQNDAVRELLNVMLHPDPQLRVVPAHKRLRILVAESGGGGGEGM